jgi:hypothetical protein
MRGLSRNLPEPGSYVNLWERIPHDDKDRMPGGCNHCTMCYLTFEYNNDTDMWTIMVYHDDNCPAYALTVDG